MATSAPDEEDKYDDEGDKSGADFSEEED